MSLVWFQVDTKEGKKVGGCKLGRIQDTKDKDCVEFRDSYR